MGLLFHGAHADADARLVQQQFQLVAVILDDTAGFLVAQALEVAADNFLAGSLLADFIVNDAVACHINAHVGGRMVRAFARNQLKHGIDNGENFDIAVIVDRRFAVCFQMERVNHVDIVQVGGSSFVSKVDWVLEGNVPDGKCFKFGVASLDAALVFMVQLGQADGHFAAAGAGSRDNDQWALGFDVIIFAVTVIAHNASHIVGVASNFVMAEGTDVQLIQAALKSFHFRRSGIHGDAHAANKQTHALERVNQAQNVLVIGDAVIAAHFVADDVLGADHNHDFGLGFQLQQHLKFGIRLEARQHAGSMIVIKQLAAKFQVELVIKLADALPDMGRLHGQVLIVIKSYFHRYPFSLLFGRMAQHGAVPHAGT